MERKTEFQLNDVPKDHISAIKFHKTLNHLLLVSSWDGSVRLYDTNSNRLIINTIHESPVLDCVFMVRKWILVNYTTQRHLRQDMN